MVGVLGDEMRNRKGGISVCSKQKFTQTSCVMTSSEVSKAEVLDLCVLVDAVL